MPFKLKTGIENFRVVDGKFAGRDFKKGVLYAEIPPEEAHKFEEEIVAEIETPKTKWVSKKAASDAISTVDEEAKS